MTRASAQVREAELVKQTRHRAFVIDYAEAILDHRLQVDPAPAHKARLLPIQTQLDDCRQLGLLFGRKLRRRAFRLAVEQAFEALGVEAVNRAEHRATRRAGSDGPCRRSRLLRPGCDPRPPPQAPRAAGTAGCSGSAAPSGVDPQHQSPLEAQSLLTSEDLLPCRIHTDKESQVPPSRESPK